MGKTIELGVTARDEVTGFEGVVTGDCSYLTGCRQFLLTPPISESGEHRTGHWFDEQRLRALDVEKVQFDNEETPGFDIPAPTPS